MRVLAGKTMSKTIHATALRCNAETVTKCRTSGERNGKSAGSAGDFLTIRVDQQRLAVRADHRLVHHHLADVLERRKLVHRVEQDLLEDRTQAPCSGFSCKRALEIG